MVPPATPGEYSRKRTLTSHSGAARKALGSRSALLEHEPAERILEEHAAGVLELADRGQPGGREDRPEPLLSLRGGRRRSGSAPRPRSRSPPPARPAAAGGRPCARWRSSARARHARP